MQNLPLFFLIHKNIRNRMCHMCVSLQYSDFASAQSETVIVRLAGELEEWNFMHRCIGSSLQIGLANHSSLLSQIEARNHTTNILCSELLGDTQRWIAADNLKQRLQVGTILCYRFCDFLSHILHCMNHCEMIVAWEIKPHCSIKKQRAMNRRLIASFTPEEWIEYSFQLLPAVSRKDRAVWLEYMQAYLPPSAWYPFANAGDLFMATARKTDNDMNKTAYLINTFNQQLNMN